MKYRYRNKPCSTVQARKKFPKVCGVGRLLSVSGERYQTLVNASDGGKRQANYEVVKVTGSNGTARLFGLLWGYQGEGPHGLRDLLLFLGFKLPFADMVAFKAIRHPNVNGTDWKIEINRDSVKFVFTHGLDIPNESINNREFPKVDVFYPHESAFNLLQRT